LEHLHAARLDGEPAFAGAVAALAGGDRHTHGVGDAAQRAEVPGRDGLLEEERVEPLERPADADRAVDAEAAVPLDQKSDLRADRLAHGGDALYRLRE